MTNKYVPKLPPLHEGQLKVAKSEARWKILCAGRRFGKTRLGVQLCLDVALRGGRAMLSLGLSRVDDLDQAVIDRYYPRLLEAYDQSIAKHSYLFPSVRQVIQQLNNAGFLLGICTNKPEALAEKLMHALKFRAPFLSLIGADTVSSRKPNPMPFFEAVYRVGGIPERSCLVGDSVTDFDTACAAGVPSILVDFGFATQDLAMLQPVSLITHFDQLEATLNKLQL